jgi:putative transposase
MRPTKPEPPQRVEGFLVTSRSAFSRAQPFGVGRGRRTPPCLDRTLHRRTPPFLRSFPNRRDLEIPPYSSGHAGTGSSTSLAKVWAKTPIYFLTTCTEHRRPVLTAPGIPELLAKSWQASVKINGWAVGRYVVMPDHVHFFAQPIGSAKSLNGFMRDWKRWTASEIMRVHPLAPPIWQREFFDHVLRSASSYGQKWQYVRENPVRAGLVTRGDDWPHAGECEFLHF